MRTQRQVQLAKYIDATEVMERGSKAEWTRRADHKMGQIGGQLI